ncbi:hypothetical protein [Paracoccus sp. MKU1]|uniref:hypothetical protein n=1 Tax=Paracoccus sp. MKU1 TaxID=1745182 RepID=UPI00071932B1|nr:hypothetical protein [Paracoccus sp. MKU1]KRW94259.1 hypothetical protein AQY21_20225 [Paracoccus sp. MKU1]
MLIQVTTGSESFKTGASKYHVFVVPSTRYNLPDRKEQHIGIVQRLNLPSIPVRQVSAERSPAAAGSMVDLGSWTKTTFEVPDGLILKVWGQRTLSGAAIGADRGVTGIGAMLIQTRASAALRRITCLRVPDRQASVTTVTLEGRFDVLTLRDAAEQGAALPMDRIGQFTSPAARQIFAVHQIDGELSARPVATVETVKGERGEAVQVQTVKMRRAIDLGD